MIIIIIFFKKKHINAALSVCVSVFLFRTSCNCDILFLFVADVFLKDQHLSGAVDSESYDAARQVFFGKRKIESSLDA